MPVLKKAEVTPDILKTLYSSRRLSNWRIADQFGVSRSHVFTLLRRNNIAVRTRAEAHRKYKRSPFNGRLEDKAYLLGFAIGDLRVRAQHEKSETIGIACSSTHPAQIALIRSLFSLYGRVWVGKTSNSGVVACEAFVDLSFSFLLPKERSIDWIFEAPSHFFAFLAGFTDAEGSIFISNQKKAILTWGQYNQHLLKLIKGYLHELGYQTGSVLNDHLKGYVGKDGYVRTQNYFHLTCAKQESLTDLLNVLKPYIKHTEKQRAISKALAFLSRKRKNAKT